MKRSSTDDMLRAVMKIGNGADLVVSALGLVPYDSALELQDALRDLRIQGEISDQLLLLEHPPVYTLGRGAAADHLGRAARGRVPVKRVGRGGEVTFHGPGQLVGYPIIDLSRRGRDVHAYIRWLENALIRAVRTLGVAGERIAGRPGVWVADRKLASIGIGVKHWVTTHGFALNVNTDLDYFEPIVPCGLPGVLMTSLLIEGCRAGRRDVEKRVSREFAGELGCPVVSWAQSGEGRNPSLRALGAGTDSRISP